MRHRLFVMGPICRQRVSHLIERLAKSCNVAVKPKIAQTPAISRTFFPSISVICRVR